jgi:hypothetical protein
VIETWFFSLKWASKRRISPFTFTVKVIAGRRLLFLLLCLCEAGLAQAVVAFEDLTALAADRLRADGGEFVGPVRLVECPVRNAESTQAVHAPEKLAFA